MKQKPRYRIVEEHHTLDGRPKYSVQKRIWFWWKTVTHGWESLYHGEDVIFDTIEAAERYINNILKFKPYKKVIKEF